RMLAFTPGGMCSASIMAFLQTGLQGFMPIRKNKLAALFRLVSLLFLMGFRRPIIAEEPPANTRGNINHSSPIKQ
ncbi:hypothetical protein ACJBV4_10470, partial [Streptococcus suis]